MNKQLKIIAIRPLNSCAPHILKVLKANTTYFLYNNYEMCDNDQFIRNKGEIIPFDFFRLDADSPNISISAIVGKNGDGKSSIIELIIRILNNFAHVYGFGRVTENLIYVEGINAELFFSIISKIEDKETEIIYKIKIDSDLIGKKNGVYLFSSDQPNKSLWEYKFDLHPNKPISSKRKEDYLPLDDSFFTMIMNYSSYAYNTNEYIDEWNWREDYNYYTQKPIYQHVCWLDNIFHKNDGYQTPIVLHPFRDEGNIEVNNEAYLSKHRMISLFLRDDKFRWINDKQYAESIEFKLEKESKLDTITFYNYFKNIYYYDSYRTAGEVPPISQLNDKLALLYPNQGSVSDDLKSEITKEVRAINRITENINSFIKDENELIKRAYRIKEQLKNDLKKERDNAESLDRETDFFTLLSDYQTFKNHLNRLNLNDNEYRINNQLKELSSYTLIQFNGNQFIRIALVAYHKKIWKEKLEEYSISSEKLNSEIGKRLFDYLIYKSISVVNKYPQYEYNRHIDTFIGFLINGELTEMTRKMHKEAIDDMIGNNSHITLKIRQTLTFLNIDVENNKTYSEDIYELLMSCSKEQDIGNEEIIENKIEKKIETVNILNIEEYYRKIISFSFIENKLIEFIPPPIFETDVILKQINKDEKSRLSHLSSGERQLVGNVSSVIYHLMNINSVKRENRNSIGGEFHIYKYKHVNLILEEIELYFHPEFQRQYVKLLLDNISKVDLTSIESINLIFVTHSPFILSDIPKQNVLFLKNGIPNYDMQENTFGANIYDLLHSSFFLKEYSGDFVLLKIGSLINEINSIPNNTSKFEVENIEQKIKLVGEPFIRTQLYRTLYERIGDKDKFKIIELRTELEELEKKIKND